MTELDLDQELVRSMDELSDDPLLLISSIFKGTLLRFGIDEETAEKAHIIFFALRKSQEEET